MSFKYFNVKNGLTTGNISLHSANANVQANYFLGNISVTSLANLGDVGNVKITGGTNGYVLQTDGTGNLSWASQGGSIASISNGTSNVNIPAVNGNINFSSAGNANVVVITGTGANISGTANVTGNLVAGNITAGAGSGGSITGGNLVSANYFTGTLTTNAQPNITSVGSLTSLSVTGNITSGNASLGNAATANFFIGSGNNLSNIAGANVSGQVANALISGTVYTNAQPNITSVGSLTGLTVSNATGVVNFTTTANVTLGAVGNLHISGGTNAYVLSTDGAGTLSWVAQSGGSSSNISNGNSNVNIPSANGNVNISAVGNANVVVITGTGANISGTANVTGNLVAGNITAGAGSGGSITGGNLVSANYFTGTLTTNAQPNITSVGSLTDLSVTGNGVFGGNLTVNGTLTYINSTTLSISDPIINLQTGPNGAAPVANSGKDVGTALNYYDTSAKIAWMGWDVSNAEIAFGSNVGISSEVVTFTELANIRSGNAQLGNNVSANFFTGNGSLLTGVTTASISNGNSNVNIPLANGNINFSAEGNANILVVTGTGANITGNLTTTNIITGNGAGGNIINANVISANTFIASGNVTAGNANLGNLAIANFFSGAGNNLSNITASNITGQVANALVAGTVYTAAQGNITSVGTLTSLGVSGTVTASTLVSNVATGTAPLTVTSTTQVANLNVATAGTVTTNAQPNITSVGNLTGLTVSNITGIVNFTTTANVTLGAVANVHISGGTNGYVLSTDGSGTLSWVAQSGGGSTSNISNGNSNVNIPAANGNINFSAVGNANVVVITGTGINVAGTLNVTGQSNLGAVGNVVITGGTANYLLSTDGTGNLSWAAPPTSANVTVDNFTGNGVQTIFTLSTTPIGINQTSVNYNGATVLRTDYTLANANITFSSAPANGSYIEVTTINLTAGGGGGTSAAAAVGYSLIFGG